MIIHKEGSYNLMNPGKHIISLATVLFSNDGVIYIQVAIISRKSVY